MASGKELVVKFVGDTSSLDKGFAKAQGESEKTAGHFGKLHTAAKLAGTVIEGGLAVALEKSVEAAKDAQASQLQMENQLKSVGIAYKAHSAEIKDSIEKTSELAAFTETDLRGSFTNLVRTTGNVKQALADSALAADVARGKGISLAAATQLVTKAELGKAGALTKAGIEAKKVTTAEDALKQKIVALHAAHVKFTPALQAHIDKMKEAAKVSDLNATKAGLLATLHQKFAGAAKTYGESAAGAQEKFKVALEELEVKLGTAVLPIMTKFEQILIRLLGWLEDHQTVMKVLVAAVGVFGAALIGINVALKAYEIATKIATAAQAVFNFVLSANPIGVVVLALAALAGAIYIAWTHSETFRRIVLGVWADIKGAVTGAINFVTVKVPEAFEHVLSWARAHWPIIATIISGPFFPLVALATNAFGIRSAIVGAFEGIKTKVVSLVGDVIDFMKTSFSTVGRVLRALVVAPIDAVISAWNRFHVPSVHIGFDTHIPGVGKVGFDTPDIGFPDIPLLAQGGIVTRATLAVLGEAGPEAVVPLSQLGHGAIADFGGEKTGKAIRFAAETTQRALAKHSEFVTTRLAQSGRYVADTVGAGFASTGAAVTAASTAITEGFTSTGDALLGAIQSLTAAINTLAASIGSSYGSGYGGGGGGGGGGTSSGGGGGGSGGGSSSQPHLGLVPLPDPSGRPGPGGRVDPGPVVDAVTAVARQSRAPDLHIHFHGNVIGTGLDQAAAQLAAPIRRELLRTKQRSGTLGLA